MLRSRLISICAVSLYIVSVCSASPVLDQSLDVGIGTSGFAIWSDGYQAMTFTAGMSGLLSEVGFQIYASAGTAGDIEFELRNTSGGVPVSTSDGVLYSAAIPIGDVPIDGSYAGSIPYTMLNVLGAGLSVQPGDVYALCLHRTGAGYPPWALWGATSDSYAAGERFWRASSGDLWTAPGTRDFGFQTWITQPPEHTREIPSTFDVEAQSTDGVDFTIVEGGYFIEQYRSPTEDTRGVMEFDVSDIPDDADIVSATLTLDISGWASVGGKYSEIDLHGYAGNGTPESADALNKGNPVGTTGPLTQGGPIVVTLNANYVESLLASTDYLGIVAESRWDYFQSVFFSSEYHEFIPSAIDQPTLTIQYDVEPVTEIPGDLDGDCDVDIFDWMIFQPNFGITSGATYNDGDLDGDGDIDI
ncbi:MAG: hypothetical protein HQ546_08185, partial [Planctomycetes bacterium]|nr:hypothetical protein [Planctomycetota bacterium]